MTLNCKRYSGISPIENLVIITDMSTLQDIERAVNQLLPEELAAFRAWFAEFDAKTWDRQFEEDVAASRLDGLADEALQHLRAEL